MESKTSKAREEAPVRGPRVKAEGGTAGREGRAASGAPVAGSCCVLQEVVREGRVVTVCVATCCEADPAA